MPEFSKFVTGRYHDFTQAPRAPDLPGGFDTRASTFELSLAAEGDPFDEDDYAEFPFEPFSESRAELVACVFEITDVETEVTATQQWTDLSDGSVMYTNETTVPPPEEEGLDRYGSVYWYSWVGRFPGEIEGPGEYQVTVEAPTGTRSRTVEVVDDTAQEPDLPADTETFEIELRGIPGVNPPPITLATLPIPQIDSIAETVREFTPSVDDITAGVDQAVSRQLRQTEESIIGTIDDRLGGVDLPDVSDIPTREEIADAVEDRIDLGDLPELDEIRRGIQADVSGLLDDLQTQLERELSTVPQSVEEVLREDFSGLADDVTDLPDNVERVLREDFGSVIDEVGEVPTEVQEVLQEDLSGLAEDLSEIPQSVEEVLSEDFTDVTDTLDGVTGTVNGLSESIGTVQDTISGIQSDASDLLDRFPDDFSAAVSTGVRDLIPSVGGADLFDEPGAWVGRAIDRALEDRLSDETRQRLESLTDD